MRAGRVPMSGPTGPPAYPNSSKRGSPVPVRSDVVASVEVACGPPHAVAPIGLRPLTDAPPTAPRLPPRRSGPKSRPTPSRILVLFSAESSADSPPKPPFSRAELPRVCLATDQLVGAQTRVRKPRWFSSNTVRVQWYIEYRSINCNFATLLLLHEELFLKVSRQHYVAAH